MTQQPLTRDTDDVERPAPRPTDRRQGARIIVAGAAVNNDNRGVEALGRSVVDHLAGATTGRVSVFDDGWGTRPLAGQVGQRAAVELVGVRRSRRWHRRESWARIRFDQTFGGLGNPAVARLAQADMVADLSGGDSFTDLYGRERLETVCAPKDAALRARRPLVLLPQTFGPFTTAAGRRRAERLVRSSALAYSRDAWSHDQLVALAGDGADQSLLREGVDVAFGLRASEPEPAIRERLTELHAEEVVGVNISGLLRRSVDCRRFGLVGDYLATMTALVRELVAAGTFVVLVAHVHGHGIDEDDATAIDLVRSQLTSAENERVWALPAHLRAAELKWCIGRMSWFAGSRMHATIASLSSAVPSFGYAYSDKTRGVFETCGVADHVADARTVAGRAAVELAMASFAAREHARSVLDQHVPGVVGRARSQLDEVLTAAAMWREDPTSVGVVA